MLRAVCCSVFGNHDGRFVLPSLASPTGLRLCTFQVLGFHFVKSGGEGFVEMEEDWEVLHEQVVHAGDGGDDAQAEEDGDVVIDW